MAQAPRQRNYRHHRGTSAQRRHDSDDSSRRNPSLRQRRDTSPDPGIDPSPCRSKDAASLRDDLVQVLAKVKEYGSDRTKDAGKDQGFSQACTPSSNSCNSVLADEPKGYVLMIKDVDLMSKVAFAVFNQDLIKVSKLDMHTQGLVLQRSTSNPSEQLQNDNKAATLSPPTKHIVDTLSGFFIAAFKHGSSGSQDGTEPSSSAMSSNASVESVGHLRVDILRALSAVLFENGSQSLQDLFQLIATVCGKPRTHEHSELRRMALNCLANLVHKTGSLFSALHDKMYDIILMNLTTTTRFEGLPAGTARRKDRGSERKEDKSLSTRLTPPLMNVICKFMFFTSENAGAQSVSSASPGAFTFGVIQRSSYSLPVPFAKSAGVSGNSPHLLDSSDGSSITYPSMQSSDSEYSDSDSGVFQAQRRQHDGKVRLNALLCLQALARAAPKQLQPHWPKFLTNSASAPMISGTYKAPSLVGLIGADPISNVRSAACVVLGNIMDSSKQYLAMAEENTHHYGGKNYTGSLALSERVGVMTRELHESIALTMAKSSLQSAALVFLTTLFSNPSTQSDVRKSILVATTDSEDGTPELMSRLLSFVDDVNISASVRVEAWNTLRAIAQFHFEVARASWKRIDEALTNDRHQDDPRVNSAGMLFLEEYSKSGANASDPLNAEWWKDALERHVLKAFGEDNPSIKALGYDCISNLPATVFGCLPDRLTRLILSLVRTADDHATARAAACRAIGVFILFPCLREDSTHILDMASTVLDLCQDSNMNVRVRASWAIGNLCDALVLLKTGGQDHVLDEILTLALWTKIMKAALSICQDHEKLKANGIRAIGGLLRVTFEGIMERERHSLVKDAVYALIKHMEQGSLKGRWNACYAVQNVLLNPDFPIGSTAGTSYELDSSMVSWTRDVYGALLQAIQHSKNFKVRINACAALTVPKTRAKYGDQAMLRKMVEVLMTAVQNLDHDQGEHDFSEFQYRDQLESKLLRCLDHLLQLTGGVTTLDLEMDPSLWERIVASRPPSIERTLATMTVTET
ncbi:armadillo-type protein [Mortierella sp. GBAus27b]|nr:armadillo-type protein [Mortierella sp. GBAus27b]